jgi:hypothetical protein
MLAPPYAPDFKKCVLLPFFGQITALKTRRSGELELIRCSSSTLRKSPLLFTISEREEVWRPSVGLRVEG